MEDYVFMNFHIKILTFLHLWPQKGELEHPTWKQRIQNYYFMILVTPNSIPLVTDTIYILAEEDVDITIIIQSLLAVACVIGNHYISLCFLRNRKGIVKLVGRIKNFAEFSSVADMRETDKKATFYAKAMMFYTTVGCLTYVVMPLFTVEDCERAKSKSMIDCGIPCGMVIRVRLPFKFDYSPLREMMALHQCFMVFCTSGYIIMLTMLLCGMLMHATHHLKILRKTLVEVGDLDDVNIVQAKVHFCIRYHIAIIKYCEDLNESFSSQMFMHVSLTSFVISILGFELLMVNTFDFIRFTLHLLGWILLLLLVSYYGQTLIDQSTGVARDAYKSKWYNGSIYVQKNIQMIITRAQKPITLNALNLGFMSLETFLSVMSTAYSYLTLLINLKK